MQGSFRLVSTRRASNHHQRPSLEGLGSTVFLWRKIAAVMPAQALDHERVLRSLADCFSTTPRAQAHHADQHIAIIFRRSKNDDSSRQESKLTSSRTLRPSFSGVRTSSSRISG